jgi:hypothetical protein
MVDEVLSTCDVSHQHKHWLLDSGASIHMCLHKNGSQLTILLMMVLFLWEMIFLVKLLELVASGLK